MDAALIVIIVAGGVAAALACVADHFDLDWARRALEYSSDRRNCKDACSSSTDPADHRKERR